MLNELAPAWSRRLRRALWAEIRNVRTTRGTRWALGLTVSLWVAVGAGVAAINVALDSDSVSVAGALLGVGAAVTMLVPVLAIFIVAADWQSRDVLTTFALEPKRHIVFIAKVTTALLVCAVLIVVAAAFAVIATVAIASATDSRVAWHVDGSTISLLLGGAAVGTISGVAYGAATQRVTIAIVFSFLQGFAIDPALMLVPHGLGSWFRLTTVSDALAGSADIAPALTAASMWLITPLAVGLIRHQRADVR